MKEARLEGGPLCHVLFIDSLGSGVLHTASPWALLVWRHFLAGFDLFDSVEHVVRRFAAVSVPVGLVVVKCALISQDSICINDEHVRRFLRFISMPHVSVIVDQNGSADLPICLGLLRDVGELFFRLASGSRVNE